MKLIPISSKGSENLYRHPETDIIYFRQYRKGRGRCEKSTFTTNITEAKRIADNYRLEFLGMTKVNRGRKFCGELFPLFIDQKRIKRPKTVISLEGSWKHLKPYIEDLLPTEITPAWWDSVYVPQKRAETHKDRKFFNDLKWLRMFLLSLKREGLIEQVPKLINPDSEQVARKVYTDAEMRRLLDTATGDLKLQIVMAFTMGMRKGEILKLAWDRIDFERRTIHLRAEDTKIGKARTFGMSEAAFKLLSNRKQAVPSAFVFPSPIDPLKPVGEGGNKTAWKNCKKFAKVRGTFHELRHTFLTRAFKSKEANPALICFYAGLSLEMAQKTYLHFDVEDSRIVSSIVGKLGELGMVLT